MNEKITIQDIPEEIRTEVIACRTSGYNKMIEAVCFRDSEYSTFRVINYGECIISSSSLDYAIEAYNYIPRRTDVFDQRELITK